MDVSAHATAYQFIIDRAVAMMTHYDMRARITTRLALALSLAVCLGCAKMPWVDRTVITENVNGVWLGFMARPNGEPMVNGQVRLELQQRASKVTGSVYASSSWL